VLGLSRVHAMRQLQRHRHLEAEYPRHPHAQSAVLISSRTLFSRCGYAQFIHKTAETDQNRIVNLHIWAGVVSLCLSFATLGGFVCQTVQFRLHIHAIPHQ
jgi:hypothetical protein